jgi:hypothetical protein
MMEFENLKERLGVDYSQAVHPGIVHIIGGYIQDGNQL